jgi:RPA family protein
MSASDDGPGRREVAHRLFAAEFDDATVSYAESDEERAPKYVVTPTGARVNRLFAVGVLTEVESVNEDVLRARVVDPTGAFVSYAGQYQPDAAAFFERAEPPTFVALTGKARTFEPDDGDRVYTSVRPESVSEVDAETRDRWTVSAAEATLRRVAAMADALSMEARGDELEAALLDRGYDEALAAGIPIAIDRYGTTVAYLDAVREVALDALEVVAEERDAVRALDTAPDDAGTTSLGPLPEAVRRAAAVDEGDIEPEPTTDAEAASTSEVDSEPASEVEAEPSERTTETEPEPTSTADVESEPTSDEPASTSEAEPEPSEQPVEPASTTEAESEPEPTTESAPASEPTTDDTADELGDFDDGDLYELDEEERREVEEEFDVGFESGAEVDDPGEADIEVPGPEDLDEDVGEPAAEAEDGSTADAGDEDEAVDAVAEADEPDAADVDLEAAAIDAMSELDDGDGAPHDDVVAAVVEEYGADPGAVADAIDDALMSGKCYEPSEDRLKSI